MDRRTAIRTLATATALPVLAPADASALLEARRYLGAAPTGPFVPAALTPTELEIVRVVSDVVLPRTGTPSASDVGVHEFVDLIVSEWMDEEEAAEIQEGLAALDATAVERFRAPFLACDPAQQALLVEELDATLPAPGDTAAERPEGFWPTLKRLVLTGYFTSEVGAAQTGYRITPGAFGGCAVPGVGR